MNLGIRYLRHGWPLLLVAGLGCLSQWGEPRSVELLRYHRAQVLEGEWWRLLSAHFVHLGWQHLLMNLAGLALVWGLFRRWLTPLTFLLWTLTSLLVIDVAFLILDRRLEWYVGLSGVLHGLMVAGAIMDIRNRHWGGELILGIVVIKLAWEQFYGPLPGSESTAGGDVVVNAHLYGAAGGLLAALAQIAFTRGYGRRHGD
ncbi:MAG: rhombosortase [Pseudomonadota bacterium]|nr:rhombosortase [Pseudomonadota bacterium]